VARKPIIVSGGTAVEHDTALPGRVHQRSVHLFATGGIAVAGGVEIASTSPLSPTRLTPEALARAGFLAPMVSMYVGSKVESPEAALIVGVALYLMLTEIRPSRQQDQ